MKRHVKYSNLNEINKTKGFQPCQRSQKAVIVFAKKQNVFRSEKKR